jgi:hypothetical protein
MRDAVHSVVLRHVTTSYSNVTPWNGCRSTACSVSGRQVACNGARESSAVSWTASLIACRCYYYCYYYYYYYYSNTNFTCGNTTYQVSNSGYLRTDSMTQPWCTKWQWEGAIAATERTLSLKRVRESVNSLSVLLRADCRAFVTFQPVKWSYQFSSTTSSKSNILLGSQFVTCEISYCSCLRCLLEVAECCIEWSLPSVMRNSLLQQCAGQYNSFIKRCSVSLMEYWRYV